MFLYLESKEKKKRNVDHKTTFLTVPSAASVQSDEARYKKVLDASIWVWFCVQGIEQNNHKSKNKSTAHKYTVGVEEISKLLPS